MTISIEQLNERKKQLAEDFNTVSKRIEDSEKELVTLRNNRNALAGALQQVNLFLQEEQPAETATKGKTNSGSSKVDKEKGMPAAKQEALNIATSERRYEWVIKKFDMVLVGCLMLKKQRTKNLN